MSDDRSRFIPRAHVIKIIPDSKMILMGGLGTMGVGQMWVTYSSLDEYSDREGFAEAIANLARETAPERALDSDDNLPPDRN